jgi:hypothetical protein
MKENTESFQAHDNQGFRLIRLVHQNPGSEKSKVRVDDCKEIYDPNDIFWTPI